MKTSFYTNILSGFLLFTMLSPVAMGDVVQEEGSTTCAPGQLIAWKPNLISRDLKDKNVITLKSKSISPSEYGQMESDINAKYGECGRTSRHSGLRCLENCAIPIRGAVTAISVLTTTLQSMDTLKIQCKKWKKAFITVNALMATYQIQCSTAKTSCNESCNAGSGALSKHRATLIEKKKEAQEALAAAKLEPSKSIQAKIVSKVLSNTGSAPGITGNAESIAALNESIKALDADISDLAQLIGDIDDAKEACDSFNLELGSAAASIIANVTQLGKSKQCEKEVAEEPVVDCTKDEYKTTQQCVCELNPRNPGCEGAAGSLSAQELTPTQSVGLTPPSDRVSGSGGPVGTSFNTPEKEFERGGDAAQAALGGGGGGGAGSGVDGGVSPSSGRGGGAAGGGPANIISGYESSSGGRGSSRGGLSGSDGRSLANRALTDARGVASDQNVLQKELTGQGGKSNFDKVRERYNDNRPTLLGR